MPTPSNDEKRAVWDAYHAGRPTRVPVQFGVNTRVVVLDPEWNPGGVSYRDCFTDARAAVDVQLRFLEYTTEHLNRHCDSPVGPPERFEFFVDVQNVYDSAYFGADVEFRDGQVPDVARVLAGDGKHRIFDVDVDRPLDNPFVRDCLQRHEELVRVVGRLPDRGIEYAVRPVLFGFDGPFTIAVNLRGPEFLTDLYEDPEYVRRVLEFITRGVVIRNRALARHFGADAFTGPRGNIADDCIQLISTEMYRRLVMPHHRRYLGEWSDAGPHGIHLCGDATRHFPAIARELNVDSFDTGYPVDHGDLRRRLGPGVQISGGPEVSLLRDGTPDGVYARTRDILLSGVKEGGRFILREANNLPPCCPWLNLEAMYRAALDNGHYE